MAVKNKEKTEINDLGQEFTLAFKDVTHATNAGSGQILLPDGMNLSEGIWWLKQSQKNEETVVTVIEVIKGYPVDVAHAMQLAVKEMFGIRELQTSGFFGMEPPPFVSVPINFKGDTVEIFTGKFALPGIEGSIQTGRDWNEALKVQAAIKQKDVPKFKAFLALTREKLQTHSLYKGQAIRVKMTKEATMFEERVTMADPEFMDTSVMPAELMLNQSTRALLEAALWTPIERAEQTKFYGVSLKRTVLLEGEYGTGKSLTAMETARRAVENGWTFIYLDRVHDLKRLYPFAQRYAPSVVFGEDVDLIVKHADEGGDNQDAINMLNNVLDGIDSKQHPILLVLTTNHVDRLPESLIRPGRFDTLVTYRRPNQETSVALTRQYAGGENINESDFDAEVVGALLAGNQPSTIHEIVKRAKLFAQQRHPKTYRGHLKLTTRDIELSRDSMQGHLELLNKAEPPQRSAMEQLGDMIGQHIVMGASRYLEGYRSEEFEVSGERAEVTRRREPITNGGGR